MADLVPAGHGGALLAGLLAEHGVRHVFGVPGGQTLALYDAIRMMHAQGKTILLVEQNARAGQRLSTHGVVLENGLVRLSGTGQEVLEHPEIGALYLGGAVSSGGAGTGGEDGSGAVNGTASRAGR